MSRRENDRVAGAGNSVIAEESGGYAGPRDPKLNPHPRQEGQATIRSNPDFEEEVANPVEKPRDASPEDEADRPPNVTPEGP